MKILYITKFFPPEYGGIETLSKNICDFFSERQNKIEVICFSKKKTYISRKNSYKVFYFKPFINLFSAPISLKIVLFIFRNFKKYDYIHIHTPNPLIEFALLFLPIKNLIVSWGSDIINQKLLRFFFRPIQYLLLKKSKKIISLSNHYLNYSDDLIKFKHKILIIPPIIKKKKNKINRIRYKNFLILSVGRLVNYKGYNIAIKAIKYLPLRYKLVIIGDGINKKKLLTQIKDLNLNKRVKIIDNADDQLKEKFLKKSSIFLMCSTSRAESFGIAILEAISYGLPLIISNVKGSGMNDMISNNFNGYKFKNFSSIDCAKKILKLSKSNKNLKQFSKNSLKLFNRKFNEIKIKHILKNIYN